MLVHQETDMSLIKNILVGGASVMNRAYKAHLDWLLEKTDSEMVRSMCEVEERFVAQARLDVYEALASGDLKSVQETIKSLAFSEEVETILQMGMTWDAKRLVDGVTELAEKAIPKLDKAHQELEADLFELLGKYNRYV